MDAWTREGGTTQGRIEPTGWTAPSGSYVLSLGFDLPGHTEIVAVGDFVQYAQTAAFGGTTKLLRASARLRPPSAMPNGIGWKLSLRIDAVERAARILLPGRTLDRTDIAANVSKLAAGSHTVALRLELVTL